MKRFYFIILSFSFVSETTIKEIKSDIKTKEGNKKMAMEKAVESSIKRNSRSVFRSGKVYKK